jgi:hypothetical protein
MTTYRSIGNVIFVRNEPDLTEVLKGVFARVFAAGTKDPHQALGDKRSN